MLDNLLDSVGDLINDKNVFITGGTGTFGHKITEIILAKYNPNKLIIFSRDEFKQYNMKQLFPEKKYPCLRYFIGDVRDYERLQLVTKNVDVLFHAAAMKQVDTVEYNPLEAIKTNIYGTENVIKVAIENNIARVIGVSTDKCVSPVNLYGATKLCLEKLIIHANLISGKDGTIFSVLRYGNVINSRGSVVPLFLKQKESNCFTITHPEMTRFTLSIDQAIFFVLNCASIMIGGEVFIPKLPSYNVLQLAKCISKDAEIKIIGIRPGEKLHESMISSTESYKTIMSDNFYVVLPEIQMNKNYEDKYGTHYMKPNTEYSSGENILVEDDKLSQSLKID